MQDPDKPMILTMARPDERKNLEKLVEVYGKSEQLQELANLVMVMGARDDLRELPKGQQQVIRNVIYLIDKYDLYGKVAYPKHHLPERYCRPLPRRCERARRVHQSGADRTIRLDAARGGRDWVADCRYQ